MGEDVLVEVESGRDLGEPQTVRRQLEHAAVGDVEDRLAYLGGAGAAEGALFDLIDELRHRWQVVDHDPPVLDDGSARGQEGAEEEQLLGVLADVDESAAAGELRPESADVD